MVEVESYELRRYLPMPYEAALGPRLLRVQGCGRWERVFGPGPGR